MLTSIGIQGFKSVHNIPSLELGQVNVFIGANGSGKTAFLEAIGVLSAAVAGRIDDESLRFRGIRLGIPFLYASSFQGLPLNSPVMLEAEWEESENLWTYQVELVPEKKDMIFKSEKIDLNGDTLLRRNSDTGAVPVFVTKGSDGDTVPVAEFVEKNMGRDKGFLASQRGIPPLWKGEDMFSCLEKYALYTPQTPVLRGTAPDTVQKNPLGLCGGGLADAAEALIDDGQEMFGDLDTDDLLDRLGWVDRMRVGRPTDEILSSGVPRPSKVLRFTDRFMHSERNELTAYDASEGVLYALFVLALAMHPDAPRFFAIDNFDQAMHPRLARDAAGLFCEAVLSNSRRPAAFFTTHNPLVLDGLDLSDERIRLFALDRNSEGHTGIRRVLLSPELIAEGAKGIPLSRLWVMGRLGGVLNV
ncbi:AAA family ATPase [Desulfobacterales bacterium HSG2]|nr:AAA family ATPase [Desulfobacterales bacterium HSG2]